MSAVKKLEIRTDDGELGAVISDHDEAGDRDGVTFILPLDDEEGVDTGEDAVFELSNEDAAALREYLNSLDLGDAS